MGMKVYVLVEGIHICGVYSTLEIAKEKLESLLKYYGNCERMDPGEYIYEYKNTMIRIEVCVIDEDYS